MRAHYGQQGGRAGLGEHGSINGTCLCRGCARCLHAPPRVSAVQWPWCLRAGRLRCIFAPHARTGVHTQWATTTHHRVLREFLPRKVPLHDRQNHVLHSRPLHRPLAGAAGSLSGAVGGDELSDDLHRWLVVPIATRGPNCVVTVQQLKNPCKTRFFLSRLCLVMSQFGNEPV